MSPELKAKWLAALRSGTYKQGHRQLKRGQNYCCLGVLCEVAGIPITHKGCNANGKGYEPLHELGAPISDCFYRNDGIGMPALSFTQIADWLEETL